MKASLTMQVWTKGKSRDAITKTILSRVEYVDAYFAFGSIIKALWMTGWFVKDCQPGAEMLYCESGLKMENYSNECAVLKIKVLKK